MNYRKLKIIIVLSFITLMFPVSFVSLVAGSINPDYETAYTKMGTANFVEDFTTTSHRLGTSTASGWGIGALTNARNFTPSFLDHYVTTNPVYDLDMQGRRAYAGIYDNTVGIDSISIFDLSDPTSITKLGGDSTWIYTMAIEANGAYCYTGQVSIAGNSVVVYDVINPAAPTDPNGQGFLDGYVTDIETDGHLVYFTNYNATLGNSLKIFYAENPLAHNLIVPDWNMNKGLGLDVQGSNVYVAASDEGFYILNTTDKYYPTEIGYISLPGNVTDVIVDGNVAYVVAGPAGLFTLDISDPSNIAILGHYDTNGNAIDLIKQGNTLFVADGAGGLVAFDVADPTHPVYCFAFLLPYTYCVELYGGVVVAGAEDGIYTIGLYAGDGITNIEDNVFGNVYDVSEAWDVRVQDDVAIVAGGPDGIYTLDVSDPNNPILLDQDILGASPFYRKLDVHGDFAYVADYGTAFRVYDISDPSNIFQTDYRSLGFCTDVYVSGDIAYLADGSAGVFIYNISDPYNIPSPFSSFDDAMVNLTSIWVQGNHLYTVDYGVGGFNPSFYVYDMSDIDVEVQLAAVNRWDTHYDVKVDGEVAYLSTDVWLTTYYVTNPAAPVYGDDLEHDSTIIESLGVWNFGPYVLSASGTQGVHLLDETNYFGPGVNTQNYPNATGAIQITTNGDYTYIANMSSLIILRHFESAGDTYDEGSAFALSTEVDTLAVGEIKTATLDADEFLPPDTSVDYYMSADGGLHWDPVMLGIEHEFLFPGDDLRWRAEFFGPTYSSAHVYEININYEFNEAPSIPTIVDIGDKTFGVFKVDWDDSTDDVAVDHYILQMSDTLSFIDITKEWTASKSQQSVTLGKGTFYFRVQSIDDEGLPSAWSLVKVANVNIAGTILYVIIGGGALVLIAAIVIPLVLVMRKKKKGTPTR
ncbi:MAG: hypothetical protein FK733_12400 [Asgard group archaeon]|nr:hypothetical protein [Asgard group archaeon]